MIGNIILQSIGTDLNKRPKISLRNLQSITHHVCTVSLILIFIFSSGCSEIEQDASAEERQSNPVEELILQADEAWSYDEVHVVEEFGYTTYVLRMTSQVWLDEERAEPAEWWHWLTIVIPDEVQTDKALLWIGGGSHNDQQPMNADQILIQAALATNSITAELHNVPFQPVTFSEGSDEELYEDALIAYGWRQFLESGVDDSAAEWLARVPMTIAAKRAMDTITEFTGERAAHSVENYVVAGASKRGWTAWTTAAFDDRVVGVAPAVIDLLNIIPSFEHHWRSLGEWSPAISDYEEQGIMDWKHSAEFERLVELVDPLSYAERLDMPKYIINSGSDEFFLPDSWQFYWDQLPGDKYLRYIPNTGHNISGTDALESLIAFYSHIVEDQPLPKMEWEVDGNVIRVETDPDNPPDEINLWSAGNSTARDFRLHIIYQSWNSDPVLLNDEGVYEITIPEPQQGYTVNFIEAVYNTDGLPFKQTTGTLVLPDSYPFDPFMPETPRGSELSR